MVYRLPLFRPSLLLPLRSNTERRVTLFTSCLEEVFSETPATAASVDVTTPALSNEASASCCCQWWYVKGCSLAVLLPHFLQCLPGRPAQVFCSHHGLHMEGCTYLQEQRFYHSRYLGGIFHIDD